MFGPIGNEWIFSLAMGVIDLLFCCIYLFEIQINALYPPCGSDNPLSLCESSRLPTFMIVLRGYPTFILLICLSVLKILIMFFFGFVLFDDPTFTVMTGPTLVSLAISIPFIVLPIIPFGIYIYIPYFIAVFPLLYNLKSWLFHTRSWTPFHMTEYNEKIILITSYLISLLYVGVCVFNFFETRFDYLTEDASPGNLTLFETIYFLVITLATVGYGDVTPKTALGRFTIIVLIVAAIAILPYLFDDLLQTLKELADGHGTYIKKKRPHVVICGDFGDFSRVQDFLRVLLKANHAKEKAIEIVLLARSPIPPQVRYYLRRNRIKNRVFYIRGSGFKNLDLERAHVDTAECAFILSKFKVEKDELEDEGNTLRAWSFANYAPSTPIYLETRLARTQYLQKDIAAELFCASDVKQIFLAYNCIYRGFSTVVLNLLRKIKNIETFGLPWLTQYADGARSLIFRQPINPVFYGESFSDVALYLYRHYQIILFSIDSVVPGHTDKFDTVLNPGPKYLLKRGDMGHYISQNQSNIRLSFLLNKANYERTKMDLFPKENNDNTRGALTSLSLKAEEQVPSNDFRLDYVPLSPDECPPLCFLSPCKQDLNERILKNADDLNDHFLVCTRNFNMHRFVGILRASHLLPSEICPILFISTRLPTEKEYSKLCHFPMLYFMIGDVKQAEVLENAGLYRCRKVVLTNMETLTPFQEADDDHIHDSDTLLIANLIEKLFYDRGLRNSPICELLFRENIHFLGMATSWAVRARRYKSDREHLIKQMHADNGYYSPQYAAGNVVSPIMLESLVSNSYHIPNIIKLFHGFAGIRLNSEIELDSKLHLEVSHFRSIPIPEDFIGKTFGELFQALSFIGVIPIGLMREGRRDHHPFVYTNPIWSLLLLESDYVYLLAPPSVMN